MRLLFEFKRRHNTLLEKEYTSRPVRLVIRGFRARRLRRARYRCPACGLGGEISAPPALTTPEIFGAGAALRVAPGWLTTPLDPPVYRSRFLIYPERQQQTTTILEIPGKGQTANVFAHTRKGSGNILPFGGGLRHQRKSAQEPTTTTQH